MPHSQPCVQMNLFSTPDQIEDMKQLLRLYTLLPFSNKKAIPGSLMEAVLAHIRGGQVLSTRDFVDVIHPVSRLGWQVKSTKADTSVTWKRAKLPDQEALIAASEQSQDKCQALGDVIIASCNDHVQASFQKYGLREIGYSRLIVHNDGRATYFERALCSRDAPVIFDAADFVWHWSQSKKRNPQEQLPALHGTHCPTGDKWWAWHGRGENQLHFSGEKTWWPTSPASQALSFQIPQEQMSVKKFVELLRQYAQSA